MLRVSRWVRKYPLLAYFVLVFAFEWVLFLLLSSSTPALIALLVGSWLPNCVGVLVTGLARGRNGLRDLFKRVILWRLPPIWYAGALLLAVAARFITSQKYPLNAL